MLISGEMEKRNKRHTKTFKGDTQKDTHKNGDTQTRENERSNRRGKKREITYSLRDFCRKLENQQKIREPLLPTIVNRKITKRQSVETDPPVDVKCYNYYTTFLDCIVKYWDIV